MADDPNRDILPVKDDSCSYRSVRCFSDIDPRERHLVCKLDRYQLEDRYLRLLEEVQNLKKLSNSQEDKIKRLATKLMRSAASSRLCPAVFEANEERERIARLEFENTRLKEKTHTLKHQLLSHRDPRSPSRCRHISSGVSSGPTTYRSESARTKYQPTAPPLQPPARNGIDDNDAQNYLVKIGELETERNEMMTRIADLENQIAVHMAGIQREKVHENVEYIRMWRQMKQANDKLISVQATNETLHGQIGDLKKLLEETTKNNKEVTAALASEKQRLSEVEDEIATAKDSQLSLREKDEQIRNLTNEMKILQQHNDELIELSSKFGQVEVENVELKRKVGESAGENQSLRAALISEQSSLAAQKAANDNLMKKLEELQRNVDSLTVQLVQNQGEKRRLVSRGSQTETKSADKNVETSFTVNFGPISQPSDEEDETDLEELAEDIERQKFRPGNKLARENETRKQTEADRYSAKRESQSQFRSSSYNVDRKSEGKTKLVHHIPTSPSMSREKMLKLLDQAQINTPLESQNAARIRQIDNVNVAQNDASSKYPSESYRDSATRLCDFTSTLNPSQELFDPTQVLLVLFEILKNYSDKIRETTGAIRSNEDLESRGTNHDENRYSTNNQRAKTSAEKTDRKDEPILLINRFTETGSCECDSNHRCLAGLDCGYGCCSLETNHGLVFLNSASLPSRSNPAIGGRGGVGEIGGLTIKEAFDSIYGTRSDVICGCNEESSDLWNEVTSGLTNDKLTPNLCPKILSQDLKRCEELAKARFNKPDYSSYRKDKSFPSEEKKDYNVAFNECGDTFCTGAFPFLITKGQGLVEIHIISLQLTTKATQILFGENSGDVSVFISWEIWGQERAFTPIAKYPSLNFNSSSVYRVPELQNFFERVLREEIHFQVHVSNCNQREVFVLAKAKLGVKDILDYPQNKLHYIAPVISVLPCFGGENFGQLSLWIRLSCDVDLVENFKDRCGLPTAVPRLEETFPIQQLFKEEKKFSEEISIDGLSSSSIPREEFYSYSAEVAAHLEERRNTSGSFLANKIRRLDTISESVEPVHRADSEKNFFINGEPDTVDSDSLVKLKKETSIRREDSASTSIDLVKNQPQPESDVEIDEVMTATSSRDLRLAALQKRLDSSDQIESKSIAEFNKVLKNKNEDGSSPRATDSTTDDLGTVIADDKWEKFKNNELPSGSASANLQLKPKDLSHRSAPDALARKNILPLRDTITISIVSMNLFENTSLMNNPEVHLLYIEYSFLGMRGADMETVSLTKPKNKGEPMVYNFTRYFQVDEEYHNSQRNILIAMLSGTANPKIRFVVVSEPLPEDMDSKECIEVGHADLNIREYALGDGLREIPLIIMNPGQSEQFGILKITIDGIEIIRNCMMVQKRFQTEYSR